MATHPTKDPVAIIEQFLALSGLTRTQLAALANRGDAQLCRVLKRNRSLCADLALDLEIGTRKAYDRGDLKIPPLQAVELYPKIQIVLAPRICRAG